MARIREHSSGRRAMSAPSPGASANCPGHAGLELSREPKGGPVSEDRATARDALRQATHRAHESLEGRLRLMSPDLTSREYSETLSRFLAVYTSLEQQIEKHLPAFDRVGLDWECRRKVPLLQRDLEVLGRTDLIDSERVPPEKVPALESFAQVMGCLYVLEGATLGGAVISRQLGRLFQLGPENGAAFFNCYGPTVGKNWQEFCVALERSLSDLPARERAAEAATATFQLFSEQVAP
jgi:heme oxygenase (biliverdin-IX-beta and delta-forming)